MKAFMEVEISEAEKTKCDRMFYWGFLGDSGLCGRFASLFLGVYFWAPGPCGRFASFSNLEDVCLFSVLTVALLEWSISEVL